VAGAEPASPAEALKREGGAFLRGHQVLHRCADDPHDANSIPGWLQPFWFLGSAGDIVRESDQAFALSQLYSLSYSQFELALEILGNWWLNRH
jgi:hypothetical protein